MSRCLRTTTSTRIHLNPACSTCDRRLVGLISDQLYEGSKKSTQQLIEKAGLVEHLFTHEFVDGVGKARLKSRRLVHLAFSTSNASPSAAIRNVQQLHTAGAINIYSSSAIEALHAGMSKWPMAETKAHLLCRLVSEIDTFQQAGMFLDLFFNSPANTMSAETQVSVLQLVFKDQDVRDLAGRPEDLLSQIPDLADDVRDALIGADSDDSEEDEEGNLAGFVAGDDEVDYDTDAGPSDDDEDSEVDVSDSNEASSSRSSDHRGRQAQRGRSVTPSTAAAVGGTGAATAAVVSPRPGTKRSRQVVDSDSDGSTSRSSRGSSSRSSKSSSPPAAVKQQRATKPATAASSSFDDAFAELAGDDEADLGAASAANGGISNPQAQLSKQQQQAGAKPSAKQVREQKARESKRNRYLDLEAGVG